MSALLGRSKSSIHDAACLFCCGHCEFRQLTCDAAGGAAAAAPSAGAVRVRSWVSCGRRQPRWAWSACMHTNTPTERASERDSRMPREARAQALHRCVPGGTDRLGVVLRACVTHGESGVYDVRAVRVVVRASERPLGAQPASAATRRAKSAKSNQWNKRRKRNTSVGWKWYAR
jgi:hypothetical protein